jgi:hypothetical protein
MLSIDMPDDSQQPSAQCSGIKGQAYIYRSISATLKARHSMTSLEYCQLFLLANKKPAGAGWLFFDYLNFI